MSWVIFGLLGVLCITGVPVAFSIGLAAVAGVLYRGGLPLTVVDQRMFTQIDSFALLAIPFFILSGNLMDRGGISNKIVDFVSDMVGHIRGGMAIVSVIASMFFGAISGSAQATSAAIGSILISAMEKDGYKRNFAAVSGPLGVIIPPSIPMVIYASAANVSIGKLFLGGYIPGLVIAFGLALVCISYAIKNNVAKQPRAALGKLCRSFLGSFWALMMVVIIMGGILGGFFTATEASVVAVVYALFVGGVIYRQLRIDDLPKILYQSAMVTAAVMFCVACTNVLGWILTLERIPMAISSAMLSLTSDKYLLLILINVIFLFVGMILDTTPAIILVVPILLPVIKNIGVDPIHFGLITVANLAIGMSTPPVGITLFVSSGMSGVPMSQMIRPLIPFWAVMFTFLLVLTYVPAITMWIPNLVM